MSDLETSNKTTTQIIYALYAAGVFFGITPFIAVIMNYLKRDAVTGTWLESHFVWQIQTFWYAFAASVVGLLLTFVLIGWPVLILVWIWYLYRVIKGWLRLTENEPML